MKKLKVIKFDLDDNQQIGVIPCFDTNDNEQLPYSVGDGAFAEKAEKTFTSTISTIKGIGNSFLQTIKSMEKVPDEVTIELGMVLSAKLGALISSTAAEANFKISMTWKNSK